MVGRLLGVGVLGFVAGIVLVSVVGYTPPLVWLVVVIGSALGVLFWISRTTATLVSCVLCIGIVLGMGRVALMPAALPDAFHPLVETTSTLEGIVVVDPDVRERNQRLTLELEQDGEKTRMLAVAPLYPEVRYGERVRVTGTVALPEAFATDGGRTFRYDEFLKKDGVFLIMHNAALTVVGEREELGVEIRGFLSDSKFHGIDALGAALPEPHASLASGLILGGKQGLGEGLLDDFITVGLVHIVVLSGYNVMIVAEFVMRIVGVMKRRFAVIAGVSAIVLFVLAAGAGAASIRAGIMASIAVYARATGRTYDALRALVLAGFLMLLINPLSLLHDPGFQLSFIATLGLIFGAPIIARYLTVIRSEFVREIAAATIAAQISVLPLLLYQNGLFSVVALPANLLVLPVVPLAMLASAFAGVVGYLAPVVAPVFGMPAYALLSYVIGVVEISAALPFAAFSLPAFPFVFVLISYGVLAYVYMQKHAV